jgi:hypothetical protein
MVTVGCPARASPVRFEGPRVYFGCCDYYLMAWIAKGVLIVALVGDPRDPSLTARSARAYFSRRLHEQRHFQKHARQRSTVERRHGVQVAALLRLYQRCPGVATLLNPALGLWEILQPVEPSAEGGDDDATLDDAVGLAAGALRDGQYITLTVCTATGYCPCDALSSTCPHLELARELERRARLPSMPPPQFTLAPARGQAAAMQLAVPERSALETDVLQLAKVGRARCACQHAAARDYLHMHG